MQIDWFTLVAQIINFLILLWLLQRFLYGPILRTMASREEKLAAQFEEAESKQRQAEAERTALAVEREELAQNREELIQEARKEAGERRRHMIHEAREETEQLKARWYDAIEREKQTFLREVQNRMGDQLMQLLRRTLSDLAGVELERAIVGVFLRRLEEEKATLVGADDKGNDGGGRQKTHVSGPIRVRTSFELPASLADEVRSALAKQLAAQESESRESSDGIVFEETDELVCGIEVEYNNRRIGWTIRDYLAALEQQLDEAILQNGLLQARRNPAIYADNGADEILPG